MVRKATVLTPCRQPTGEWRSLLLVDGAQLVPGTPVDVQALDVDFLSFSFHKMLAPFGVGVLYAKDHLLESLPPFLYGGDMIAEGEVTPGHVGYNCLPWKYAAGTPNILGTIVSAQAIRLLIDLALNPERHRYFGTVLTIDPADIREAMTRVMHHGAHLTGYALDRLSRVKDIVIYGPRDADRRTSLVAFNVPGISPMDLAESLNAAGIESRAGCHCATLAHHELGLDPSASCRLSFYLYNSMADVDRATSALLRIANRLAASVEDPFVPVPPRSF